jgi:hypothetical protein
LRHFISLTFKLICNTGKGIDVLPFCEYVILFKNFTRQTIEGSFQMLQFFS